MMTPLDKEFSRSVVFITGGGAGIGKATAELFLDRGAAVSILDPSIENAANGCNAYPGSVTDDDAVRHAIEATAEKHGRIDILVNNAGISFYGPVQKGSLLDWHHVLDVNLLGVVRCTRSALPHLRASSHGAIINIASCLARSGLANRALYSATKGAVESLTRAMAADLIAEGIRVNCVSPGTVDTGFVRKLVEAAGQSATEFSARQATGRMVSPDEVAHAIAYLARPGAHSTVGTVLAVDGGFVSLHA